MVPAVVPAVTWALRRRLLLTPCARSRCTAAQFHGEDGLGDRPEVPPSCADVDLQAQSGHASMHLAAAAQVGTG